jgi:nitronate monooxygenase
MSVQEALPVATAFTELFHLRHPIALAPMGGSAGGALAAAVSNGGGLGLVGGGREDDDWIARELQLVTAATEKAWGIGFQAWSATEQAVELSLTFEPDAVMLSFGDPRRLAALVTQAGVPLIVQVTDLHEAAQALELGAAVIVAQGLEAGGHSGRRATLPFVPAVVDLAAPTPVLAAGGIADGRGVAAALMLGAAGVLLGTRFLATPEAIVSAQTTRAILDHRGEDTEKTRVFDIAGRRATWPSRYAARVLRNEFLDHWRGHEDALDADDVAKHRFQEAVDAGDMAAVPIWASEAIDLIGSVVPAAELIEVIVRSAHEALQSGARTLEPAR